MQSCNLPFSAYKKRYLLPQAVFCSVILRIHFWGQEGKCFFSFKELNLTELERKKHPEADTYTHFSVCDTRSVLPMDEVAWPQDGEEQQWPMGRFILLDLFVGMNRRHSVVTLGCLKKKCTRWESDVTTSVL